MPKLPVGRTIEAAYRFALKQFFAVLAIIWFPYLVVIAIVAALGMAMAPGLLQAAKADTLPLSAIPGLVGLGLLLVLGLLVAGAMARVGLMRRALGMQTGWVFIYFSFAAPVWRMLGAMILAMFIVIGIVVAGAAAVGVVWGITHALLSAIVSGIATGIAAVVAVLVYFYSVVRLVFFLPAVVVAEEQIGIGRAWALGGGNFWRIIIVILAIFIPVLILFGAIGAVLGTPMIAPAAEPATVHEAIKHAIDQLAAAINPLTIPFEIAYITVLTGLGSGAVAGAYRAIVSPHAGEDTTPPAESAHA